MVHDRHPLPCAQRQGGRAWSRATRRCRAGISKPPPTRRARRSTAPMASAPTSRAIRPSSGSPTWTAWGSTSRRSRRRRARPITAPTPISASRPRARSTTSSPRSAASIPDRFVGLGTVPFQAPELAIAELDRLHKSLGFRGIEIMTHVAGEDLSAERFRPVLARIEELGLLVFMHPDGFTEAAPLPRPLSRQRDRQPARYDGGRASPDLRRGAGESSRA